MFKDKRTLSRALSLIIIAGSILLSSFHGWGEQQYFKVTKVSDGDTITLSNGEHVRLIGIDCPELHNNPKLYRDSRKSGQDVNVIKQMGQKAYEFTRRLVDGKNVRLDYDVQPRDRYGRVLAYVYLEDGTFVNAEIIKNGFASPLTIPPDVRNANLFKRLYEEARRDKKGLWAKTEAVAGR